MSRGYPWSQSASLHRDVPHLCGKALQTQKFEGIGDPWTWSVSITLVWGGRRGILNITYSQDRKQSSF